MNTVKSIGLSKPRLRVAGILAMVASLHAMNAGATMVVGDANTTTVVTPTTTTITVTNNATLTVTVPGEIEILLVGGGGGAGGLSSSASGYNSGESRGGGGGGGGVIHKTNFNVSTGRYDIVVGAGGTFCTSANSTTTAIGGSTSGFGLTALGGGPGGWVDPAYDSYTVSSLGASGGGGSKSSASKAIPGGTGLASAENENLGNKGANADTEKNAGGGGGAGAAGSSYTGGDGYACDITGETVYYGGGGGGGRRYYAAVPGQGGGKSNWGGGGSGQSSGISAPESGGPGIVIVRFTPTASSDFRITGYDKRERLVDDYVYLVVTNNTTLHVTGSAPIELLLVGGGGGAGGGSGTAGYNSGESRGGGGGGGGVIHKMNFSLEAGTYPITVGAGGAVNTSDSTKANAVGGNTTGFNLTALGGGPGGLVDPAYNYSISNLGASGGGGSKHNSNGKASPGGSALASAENENMGHAGANADTEKNAGGGGGAGAAGSSYTGGDGYACDITGETVYYGGGGGGGRRYYAAVPGQGGGKSNWGGGGSGQSAANTYPESGGHGIVIIRYRKPPAGMAVFVR